jgi:phosphoglycerate kinase
MKFLRNKRNLEGKHVMVRVDFNVPVKNGRILDNTRILASIPTLEFLMDKKAKIIIITHFGRPKGRIVPILKIDVIQKELEKLLHRKIVKLDTKSWKLTDKQKQGILRKVDAMRNGSIAIVENIRFSIQEKDDKGSLSQKLANLADIFVLDGFGVAHRSDASVVGIPKYIPSCAGLLLEREYKALQKILKKPKAPITYILGGIKLQTKIPLMKALLKSSDHILIGGGIFNTYLASLGYGVGSSIVDKTLLAKTKQICRSKKVYKPVDVLVGDKKGKTYRVVDILKKPHTICKRGEMILDIGPMTVCHFASIIKQSQTLIWNGAMGFFEQTPYDMGTRAIARLVAQRSRGKAFGIIGGGETIEAMELVQMDSFIDFVSTGGGAMLAYLSQGNLPGIDALNNSL